MSVDVCAGHGGTGLQCRPEWAAVTPSGGGGARGPRACARACPPVDGVYGVRVRLRGKVTVSDCSALAGAGLAPNAGVSV